MKIILTALLLIGCALPAMAGPNVTCGKRISKAFQVYRAELNEKTAEIFLDSKKIAVLELVDTQLPPKGSFDLPTKYTYQELVANGYILEYTGGGMMRNTLGFASISRGGVAGVTPVVDLDYCYAQSSQ